LHSSSLFQLVNAAIIIGGSLFFVLCTFFTRPWTFAAWVKTAFWILGLAGIACGLIRLVLFFHSSHLSRQTYHFLASTELVLLGIAFGVLVLFFASGEAYQGWRRWRELTARPS
jgi:uncharacterized membrane protein YidH (DUF202 family)